MQLLKHFKELTIHPKNAKELKGLILQLAIQGKLTQKWREERSLSGVETEPASVLLERIKEEKAQLVKEKKIKKEKALPEIAEDEMPFELPVNWAWCRFGTLSKILNGRAYKKQELLDDDSLTPVLRVGNLFTSNSWYYSNLELEPDKYIEKGDLIFAWSASFGPFIWEGPKSIYHYHIWKLDHTKLVHKEYLKLFLDAETERIKASGSGIAMIHMTKGKMELLPTKLPPLEEQRAIVSIVNQLFTEVDQLEAQTQERVKLKEDFVSSALKQLAESKEVNGEWAFLQQHFKAFFTTQLSVKKLRETILQLAVQGKLTHHWRNSLPEPVEGASVLLERIKAEKEQLIKDKKIKKEKPLPEITKDEIPYELPDGWVWCRFKDIGIVNPRNQIDDSVEIGFVPMKDISQTYSIKPIFEVRKWKDVKSGFTHFKNGDIAFAKITPCFENSKACVFSLLPNGFGAGTTELHVLRPITNDIEPDFVYCIFKSPQFLIEGESKMTGSAGQKRVPKSYFEEYLLGLPPLEEQKAIVAKVNSLMALCDNLEQEIEQNTKQVEDLMQSCLKEVFEN